MNVLKEIKNEISLNEIMAAVFGDKGRKRQDSVKDALDVLRAKLADESNECFYCFFFDKNKRFIELRKITEGSVDRCCVFLRPVVKAALDVNAKYILYAHNHPGGAESPSWEDVKMTQQHRDMLKSFDLEMEGHAVLTIMGISFVP